MADRLALQAASSGVPINETPVLCYSNPRHTRDNITDRGGTTNIYICQRKVRFSSPEVLQIHPRPSTGNAHERTVQKDNISNVAGDVIAVATMKSKRDNSALQRL